MILIAIKLSRNVWLIGMMAAWELLALQQALTHPVQRVPTLVALGLALPALWYGSLSMLLGVIPLTTPAERRRAWNRILRGRRREAAVA